MGRVGIIACVALPCLGLPAQACEIFDALDTFTQTDVAPAKATCDTYLSESGSIGTACNWEFPYRAPEAITLADILTEDIQICRPVSQSAADAQVNHPDSYDLRTWVSDAATYALSVKDKGNLQRTFVFLRREPR